MTIVKWGFDVLISLKKMTVVGLFLLLVSVKTSLAEEAVAVDRLLATPVDAGVVEMAPPAPPGPYKSTGLSNITARRVPAVMPAPAENVSDKPANMPAVKLDSPEMPMAAFSPDIPWPTNLRPQNTVTPHRYAPGYQAPRNNPPVDNRYRPTVNQNVNLPYMNNQRSNVYGPNTGSSNYGYQIPSNVFPRYAHPSGYPMSRMPYPSSYQPSYPN